MSSTQTLAPSSSMDGASCIKSVSLKGLGHLRLHFSYESAKMIHFDMSPSNAYPTKERLLGSGFVQLVEASSINTVFLKVGTVTHPILPRSKCWRVGKCFIFPVVRSFWRLELIHDDGTAADDFAMQLAAFTRFDKDPLPFNRNLFLIDRAGNLSWNMPRAQSSKPREAVQFTDSFVTASAKDPMIVTSCWPRLSRMEDLISPMSLETESDCSRHSLSSVSIPDEVVDDPEHEVNVAFIQPSTTTAIVVSQAIMTKGEDQASEEVHELEGTILLKSPELKTESQQYSGYLAGEPQQLVADVDTQNPSLKESCTPRGTLQAPSRLMNLFRTNVENHSIDFLRAKSLKMCLGDEVDDDDWNILVDELDLRNQSIARRLSAPVRIATRGPPAMEDRCNKRGAGLLYWTGEVLYSAAHSLSLVLQSRQAVDTGTKNVSSPYPKYRSILIDDALDDDLDAAFNGDVSHLCECLWRSVCTIGRAGRVYGA